MASHEQSVIEQATPLTGPTVNAEDKPILKNDTRLQDILFFRRFRQSILIKSKAANMILFWNTLVVLMFGLFADPGNVFVSLFNLFGMYPFFTRDAIVFYIMIGSGVYGVIAFWLLFYPLAGYLADVRFGRYKVVMCGLKTMWGSLLSLIICGVVICSIGLPVILLKCSPSFCSIFIYTFDVLANV